METVGVVTIIASCDERCTGCQLIIAVVKRCNTLRTDESNVAVGKRSDRKDSTKSREG